ncbi:nondiscriminating glutamyl-tRNA synthetase EARS2, mitochondrial isoform X2 [Palaemon carinicauda]|uniref:nondiscriminating glutamyl-tRNA synthetase EARS2, mitochondrial isoform X2 n=1 Tax=Palaemon carinicauda TaxID=392227 RepID=UPI0035B60891
MTFYVLWRNAKILVSPSKLCRQITSNRSIFSSKNLCSEVRVRFAPSPTGFLHLGGLRTALYNYLFAKSRKGKFILRIEDTDQTRLVPEAAEKLETVLNWAKIVPDESPLIGGSYGPYAQSQRKEIYSDYIKKLLHNRAAYKCFCSETRLNLLRRDLQRRGETVRYDNRCQNLSASKIENFERQGLPYCIRLKLEDITEPFEDLVYGPILNNIAELEGDPVLVKTDGYPTYHFANVVDDHLMEITHVLRGVEWQVSTPKHLLIYKAFGWDPPNFAHLPLIKNSDGTKLSKRQGDLHVESLKAKGYSATAVLNFITNIGGGFENRDHNAVYSIDELISKFNLGRINTNSCKLEIEKLSQFNQLQIQRCLEVPSDASSLIAELRQLLKHSFQDSSSASTLQEKALSDERLLEVLLWSKDRIFKLSDLLSPEYSYIWAVPQDLSFHLLPSMSSAPADVLHTVIDSVASIPENKFDKDNIGKSIKDVGKRFGLKTPVVMALVRRAVSGLKQGPPVGEMLAILGKETSLDRLKYARSLL